MTRPTWRPNAPSSGGRGEAIASLPDDRRQAVVLRLVNELRAREIGDIMGRSEGAVRVLIHRGLTTVRARMRG